MSLPSKSKAWLLQNKADKEVDLSPEPNATFALAVQEIPSPIPEDSLLVKPVLLSNDPAQRAWIQKNLREERSYIAPLNEGDVMRSSGISKVLQVGGEGDTTFKKGDLIFTYPGWCEYAIVKKAVSRIIDPIPGLPISAFLGMLGIPGFTAYWGLVEILKFKPGETLIVSGAAGATGNVVVQLAKKVMGAKKVVAIVGSDEKAEWIKGLGADVAINYKHPNWRQDLSDATPEFAEAYFDNVGGEILDFVLTRIKRYGRIAACGAISTYNNPTSTNLTNYSEIIMNRLTIQGFVVRDFLSRPECMEILRKAHEEGMLVHTGGETIVKAEKFEDVPKIWYRLFEGRNTGKLVTEMP